MLTTVDKAIVALIGSAIILINTLTSLHFGLDPSVVDAIAAILTPILVHQVPNKPA